MAAIKKWRFDPIFRHRRPHTRIVFHVWMSPKTRTEDETTERPLLKNGPCDRKFQPLFRFPQTENKGCIIGQWWQSSFSHLIKFFGWWEKRRERQRRRFTLSRKRGRKKTQSLTDSGMRRFPTDLVDERRSGKMSKVSKNSSNWKPCCRTDEDHLSCHVYLVRKPKLSKLESRRHPDFVPRIISTRATEERRFEGENVEDDAVRSESRKGGWTKGKKRDRSEDWGGAKIERKVITRNCWRESVLKPFAWRAKSVLISSRYDSLSLSFATVNKKWRWEQSHDVDFKGFDRRWIASASKWKKSLSIKYNSRASWASWAREVRNGGWVIIILRMVGHFRTFQHRFSHSDLTCTPRRHFKRGINWILNLDKHV